MPFPAAGSVSPGSPHPAADRNRRLGTLHGYILRELLKTFGLTLLALTALFTMGGGLYNAVSSEGVTAADVLGFVPLLVPIVATIVMPMAALFAVTMVYGRLAADNELVACRAAGINVHRMFLGAALLALFVAGFTTISSSFIIPGFVSQIESYARRNIRDLVAQNLSRRGFAHRGKAGEDRYTLTAEEVQGVSEAALREKGFEVGPGLHYLQIRNPTFLHIDKSGNLRRFASAQWGMCVFDTRPTPIEFTLIVRDARDYEVGKRAVYVRQQQIGPVGLPLPVQTRLSTADLRDLVRWRNQTWEAPTLREGVQVFLVELRQQEFCEYVQNRINAGETLELADDIHQRYTIRAESASIEGARLVLVNPQVAVYGTHEERPVRYEAPRAELKGAPNPHGEIILEIRLLQTDAGDVREYHPRAANYDEPRPKPTTSLDGVQIPADILNALDDVPPSYVLDPNQPLQLTTDLADKRVGLQRAAAALRRKIGATIHFRLGYATSILVTALMGAALGVIFRGSRALAALFLSLIPFVSVMLLMVMGRQLAEDASASPFGVPVIWGSLLAGLVADFVILRVGVRR